MKRFLDAADRVVQNPFLFVLALSVIVLSVLGFAVRADSQPISPDRAEFARVLAEDYNEAPRMFGVTKNGAVVEVFHSPGGDTWSIIVTLPDGRSQIVAAGTDWTLREAPAAPKPGVAH